MTVLRTLRLKKNAERRLKAGHLWLYSNEIDTEATPLKALETGEQVVVELAGGTVTEYVGGYTAYVPCGMTASCTDHSLVRVSFEDEGIFTVDIQDWVWPEAARPARPAGPPPFATGQEAEVRNRHDAGINLRNAAGTQGTGIVRFLENGMRVVIQEGPITAPVPDGNDWYHVRTPVGVGWVAGFALRPLGEAERERQAE